MNRLFEWYDRLYPMYPLPKESPPTWRYGTASEQLLRQHQQLMAQENETANELVQRQNQQLVSQRSAR